MPSADARILVVSRDPALAGLRKSVLEAAGFQVISATSDSPIREICTKKKPRLVMIGYSVPPAAKRRVWDQARKSCNVPILELHQKSGPELMPPAYFHQAQVPDDFINAVNDVLRKLIG